MKQLSGVYFVIFKLNLEQLFNYKKNCIQYCIQITNFRSKLLTELSTF